MEGISHGVTCQLGLEKRGCEEFQAKRTGLSGLHVCPSSWTTIVVGSFVYHQFCVLGIYVLLCMYMYVCVYLYTYGS